MKKLDPKAVWLFFIQYSLGWIFFILFFGGCFMFPMVLGIMEDSGSRAFGTFAMISIVIFLVTSVLAIIGGYFFAKLTYDNYKFELTEDGFYKESGVITKKYVTIPYERIQNVDINRGILARIFGLSDLQIQTAGMSASFGKYGAYNVGAEGRLPAVSEQEAIEIRNELIKRAKGHKATGGL